MLISRSGFGFGLGLGALLLLAVLPWIVPGLRALPYFLGHDIWLSGSATLGLEIALVGLVAGWFAHDATRRVGRQLARIAWMTLLAVALTTLIAFLLSALDPPFARRILRFYLLALPLPCLVVTPPWAAFYLRRSGPAQRTATEERDSQ
ncbi:hypothetical protein [Reyranella sp.]|jgi:hypothetical protein|uniref:hypothetical protein n=1 Tax=Reyranella sp. TaxID=1929291 RepID=UPI002F92DA3F